MDKISENKYIGISKASELLGVSEKTLRRWDESGKLKSIRFPSGHRKYLYSEISNFDTLPKIQFEKNKRTICYARVPSERYKDELFDNLQTLKQISFQNGYDSTYIYDIDSGLEFKRKGFEELTAAIVNKTLDRIVVLRITDLIKIGLELFFTLLSQNDIELVVLNKGANYQYLDEAVLDADKLSNIYKEQHQKIIIETSTKKEEKKIIKKTIKRKKQTQKEETKATKKSAKKQTDSTDTPNPTE